MGLLFRSRRRSAPHTPTPAPFPRSHSCSVISVTSCVIRPLTAQPMSISARVGVVSTCRAGPAGPGPNGARSLSGRTRRVTVSRFRGISGLSGLCFSRLCRKRFSWRDLGPGVEGVGRGSRASLKSRSNGRVDSCEAESAEDVDDAAESCGDEESREEVEREPGTGAGASSTGSCCGTLLTTAGACAFSTGTRSGTGSTGGRGSGSSLGSGGGGGRAAGIWIGSGVFRTSGSFSACLGAV